MSEPVRSISPSQSMALLPISHVGISRSSFSIFMPACGGVMGAIRNWRLATGEEDSTRNERCSLPLPEDLVSDVQRTDGAVMLEGTMRCALALSDSLDGKLK